MRLVDDDYSSILKFMSQLNNTEYAISHIVVRFEILIPGYKTIKEV